MDLPSLDIFNHFIDVCSCVLRPDKPTTYNEIRMIAGSTPPDGPGMTIDMVNRCIPRLVEIGFLRQERGVYANQRLVGLFLTDMPVAVAKRTVVQYYPGWEVRPIKYSRTSDTERPADTPTQLSLLELVNALQNTPDVPEPPEPTAEQLEIERLTTALNNLMSYFDTVLAKAAELRDPVAYLKMARERLTSAG